MKKQNKTQQREFAAKKLRIIATSICIAFPIFQNSMQQPMPELASIIHEVSLSSRYKKTISWDIKLTMTDFAESPSIDLFLFQNWISEVETNNLS